MKRLLVALGMLALIGSVVAGVLIIRNRAAHHHPPRMIGPALAENRACPGGGWQALTRPPLYILPHVENLDLTAKSARRHLAERLDEWEPDGPTGKVRLGYTLGALPLASYRKTKDGEWVLDLTGFERNLDEAAKLGRPFAVYVLSNHFQPRTELVEELLRDPRNRMTYADETLPKEGYFKANLVSFTLSTDPEIPVTRLTFAAMRAIADALARFDKAHPGLLQAIELNGETHYLFERFYDGTGNFDHPRLTDFSDTAMAEFQRWLDTHGYREKAEQIREMAFDRFEAGWLPVSGWIYDPAETPRTIDLLVDGKKQAEAYFPVNRLDAYEDITRDVKTPNTGFGYQLDVSTLPAGQHVLQALASFEDRDVEVGRRSFWTGSGGPEQFNLGALPGIVKPADGSLDIPTDDKHVAYRPLARHFVQFRAGQIARYVAAQAALFRDAGLPRERLFSYQLAPWMFGNWNPLLFGVSEDFFRTPDLLPGINLYGGNMLNPLIDRFLDAEGGYGVPEMHPQMLNSDRFTAESLAFHYCNGARYLSPYFLQLGKKRRLSDHDRFRLSEDNPSWGSDGFTRAIKAFVRK